MTTRPWTSSARSKPRSLSSIGPSAIFYALLAIGLNLHFGYTGLLNFGQIGFALLGGYGVGIMTITYHLPLWVGILVGLAAAGLLAVVLGIPTLRLRADYLAIVTIAASEVMRLDIPFHCFGSRHRIDQRPVRIRRPVHQIQPLRLREAVLLARA